MSRRKLAIGIFLFVGLLINAVALGANVDYQVDRSEDDIFQSEVGAPFVASPFIAISEPNYGIISNFLFRNVTIYNSRIINNATLSVYTTGPQDADLAITATIYGLEVNDGGLVNGSSLTIANVVWNISQVRGSGTWHNVTVTSVVQEIIDRYGWDYGDNLAFEIVSTAGTTRHVVAYDYGNPTLSARLYITYGVAPPDPPGLAPGAEYNQTVEGYDIYEIPGTGQVTSFTSSMLWDDSGEVYPYQGKTAFNNITNKFYIFGTQGDRIGYHFRDRYNLTWSNFITLYEHLAGGDIWTDYFIDAFGKLHVGWVWSLTNDAYYMKFDLLSDGSATNYTGRQTVDNALTFYGPVVVASDSEGYPYMAYDRLNAGNYGAWVAWSTLNNGTWNHQVNSPESVEINLGVNPPNTGWFACELVPMGDRRMDLIVSSPDVADVYTCSKRNQNSGAVWTGEGEFQIGDRQTPLGRRYAISGASVTNMSDETDAWTVRNDEATNDLWEYVPAWAKRDNNYLVDLVVAIIGIEGTGEYVTIGYDPFLNFTKYGVIYRNDTRSSALALRDFGMPIAQYELVAHQYPQELASENRTIVSYAWRHDASITFYHDWFYMEDGPTNTTTDPYYEAYDNGTLAFTCDTLDCLIDLITGTDPDPQDPEPSPWVDSPALLGRFAMRRYFLMIGWGMVWGPIWLFCYRRPSGYMLCAGFIFMLIGLGLLLQIPYI